MNAHDGRSTRIRADAVVDLLRGGHRLPGEDRLVAFRFVRLDDPQVGGNNIADPQLDDVAWDEDAHVQLALAAIAPDERLVMDVGVECGDSPCGAARPALPPSWPGLRTRREPAGWPHRRGQASGPDRRLRSSGRAV